jgi:O-antigen ligase
MRSLFKYIVSPIGLLYLFFTIIISTLIYSGNIGQAGIVVTIVLLLSFFYSLVNFSKGPEFFSSILFIFSPFLAFLRSDVISYNGLSLILLLTILIWIIHSSSYFAKILFQRNIIWFILFYISFVLYGLLLGNSIYRFMKFIETLLSIVVFSLYLRKSDEFSKFSIYFIMSSILLVIALSGNIETRFVFEDSESNAIKADPSMLSLNLILSSILLLVDKGYWVSLFRNGRNSTMKYLFLFASICVTVITTSRIGMFVAFFSILAVTALTRVKLKTVLFIPILLTAVFIFISNSRFSDIADHWFNKTFNNESGIEGATTGRSSQWEMTWEYLKEGNIFDIITGYGPGNAPVFSEVYSKKIDATASMYGKAFEMHSFYLNVLIEFGLIAFVIFLVFFVKRLKYLYYFGKKSEINIGFIIMLAYMFYIFSVSGLGIVSGIVISIFINNLHKKDKILILNDRK